MTTPKPCVCKRCSADPKAERHTCSRCGRTACKHLSVAKETPGFFGPKKTRICGPCNLATHPNRRNPVKKKAAA